MLARVVAELRRYWRHILLLFALQLLAVPLELLIPIPLKIAVDNVLGGSPPPRMLTALVPGALLRSDTALLLFAVGLQILVVFAGHLQGLGSEMLRTVAGERMTLDLRSRLLRNAQRLSYSFHDGRGTAESVYRIQYDAQALQHLTTDGVLPIGVAVVSFVTTVWVIVRISDELALVALAVSPVLFVVSRFYGRRIRPRYRHAKELESGALKVVQEVLTSLRVVQAFGREDQEEQRFVGRLTEGASARVRLALAESVFGLVVGLTTAAGTAAVLYIGVRNIQRGALTLGELLMITTYLAQLYGPLKTISRRTASLQSSVVSAERAFDLLDQLPDVREFANARLLKRALGRIEFREVSFAYGDGPDVLHQVSLVVEPGARVGVAGRTGAGKSTLLSLLPRFHDPTAGAILLDGVDLRGYRLRDLRNQFALVLQDSILFSASIAENIAYGRPGASARDILAAAEAANAHDFISALPQGYDTLVGERGMRLSGGERQRMSLARAFLKDAPILILDEPTSAVDVHTEAVIMDAIGRLMTGRTTFLITHRLHTLETCDQQIVLDHGCVVPVAALPAEGVG